MVARGRERSGDGAEPLVRGDEVATERRGVSFDRLQPGGELRQRAADPPGVERDADRRDGEDHDEHREIDPREPPEERDLIHDYFFPSASGSFASRPSMDPAPAAMSLATPRIAFAVAFVCPRWTMCTVLAAIALPAIQ